MSRIGLTPIPLPDKVEVKVSSANEVSVKGPKGELQRPIGREFKVEVREDEIEVIRPSRLKRIKSLHGTYRALINNMVIGVTEGFKKELELVGVGYKASNNGQILDLSLGFSHNFIMELPKEVSVTTVSKKGKSPLITLESIDNEILGQVAAKIRSLRKPEPYQGKGVRYKGEIVRRKAGKTASK